MQTISSFLVKVSVNVVNYCTIITCYKIVIDICFCDGQSSKGNYSKSINDRVTSGFQVIEWTRFVTDRRTDRRPGKNNMSPDPEGGGGGHRYKLTYLHNLRFHEY